MLVNQWLLVAAIFMLLTIGKAVCENVILEVIAEQKMLKAELDAQERQSKLITHEQGGLVINDRETYGNEPENSVIAQL